MIRNKTLTAAIVAALSLGGVTVQAAFTTNYNCNDDGATNCIAGTPVVAMELFDSDEDQILPDDGAGTDYFTTTYTWTPTTEIDKNFYITYTMSGGEWANNVNGTFNVVNGAVDPVENRQDSEVSSAKFAVLAADTPLTVADGEVTATFVFQLKGLTSLKQANIDIQQDIILEYVDGTGEVEDATQSQVTVVSSGIGTAINYSDSFDPDVEIDVAEGGTKFTGSVTGSTEIAILGTIEVADADPDEVEQYNLDTDWAIDDGTNGANNTNSLTINDGPFAGSLSHDPNATEPVYMVYIDITGTNCAIDGDTVDVDFLPATEVTQTAATWENLTAADLALIDVPKSICVAVPADNTTSINESTDKPEAVLTVDYKKRSSNVASPGKLKLIKRNGKICTVYNVTDTDANDITNVRITSRSSREGTLTASLRKTTGEYVFQDVDIMATLSMDPAKIQTNQTVKIKSSDIETLANGEKWGRGVLTISSDLDNIEVYGLLRGKGQVATTQNPDGSLTSTPYDPYSLPLLNMSVGGSGSGCD